MEGESSHENHPPSLVVEDDDHHISTKKQGPTFIPFKGFWYRPRLVPNIISFQKHFQALDDDIIVCSKPKAGTTWLKALVFTIVNRNRFSLSSSPLNIENPHQLVPFLELMLYDQGQIPDLTSIPSPRLFGTHLPYAALADSIKQAKSRIIYVTRNPLDVIVSFWHFIRGLEFPDWPLEECFEVFCRGEEGFGPFWDHALGYWKESLEKPHKVLFLRYEHLKENPVLQIKRIAEFIAFPFSEAEERAGAVEEIAKFCSLSNMKDLMGNYKTLTIGTLHFQSKNFFRKGEVADHINHLSPSAIERFSKILEEKLHGSGLAYDYHLRA